MVNQYGQTDIMQALLAQGTSPSPYKTGLGQAARLGGVALAEWGKRKKADESRSALADALAGLNGGALTGEGPTTGAAGNAPIGDPQLLARLLSDPNTAQVGQALLGRALQSAPERKVIKGADGYSYYQDTQDRVLPGVQKQQDMKFGWRMGPNGLEPVPGGPNDPAYIEQTAPHKRSQTNVTVNGNTQQTAEQKARGNLLVSNFGEVQTAANQAREQRALLEQAKQINGSGVEAPSEFRQMAGNLAVSLGFDPKNIPGLQNISDGQQFNGVMQNLVLAKMQAQKGPQTENDAKRIESTVASLGNTPEARSFLLDSALAMNQLDIMRELHWQEWWQNNGTYDGASAAWNKGLGNERIVARNPKSGRTVFLPEFITTMQSEHPDATRDEILNLWRSYE